jgi:hypothetical protein
MAKKAKKAKATQPASNLSAAVELMPHPRLLAAIGKLITAAKNPTPEAICSVAPQLTLQRAAQLIEEASTIGRVRFAGPPVAVQHTYQVYVLHKAEEGLRLYRGCAYREAGLGAYTGSDDLGARDALLYAAQYANELLPQPPSCTVSVEFVEMVDGLLASYVGYGFACDYPPDMLAGMTCEPAGELLDDVIQVAVATPAELDELTLGAHVSWLHFCKKCGGGMSTTACVACNTQLPTARTGRICWGGTVPNKLVRVINRQYPTFFTIPPIIARAKEHLQWAYAQLDGVPSEIENRPKRFFGGTAYVDA